MRWSVMLWHCTHDSERDNVMSYDVMWEWICITESPQGVMMNKYSSSALGRTLLFIQALLFIQVPQLLPLIRGAHTSAATIRVSAIP